MNIEPKYLSSSKEIFDAFDETNVERIIVESKHLFSLGLIFSGVGRQHDSKELFANLGPTALGCSLFIRGQGSSLSPEEYFSSNPPK